MPLYPKSEAWDALPNNGSYLHDNDIVETFTRPDQTFVPASPFFRDYASLTTEDGDHLWRMGRWLSVMEPPPPGGFTTPVGSGPVELRGHKLLLGPWSFAVVACGLRGELEMTIDDWSPTHQFAHPWVAVLSSAFNRGQFQVPIVWDLMLQPNAWRHTTLGTFSVYRGLDDTGGQYGFSPSINKGDTLNVFYYSRQELHLYVNGAEVSAIHVDNGWTDDGETPEFGSTNGYSSVLSRYRGVATTDNTVTLDSFRWTGAVSDAAVAELEQRFHRPRSLGGQ